jgi:hypothetical protein
LLVRSPNQEERTLGVAFHIRETPRIVGVTDIWDEIRESEKGRHLYQRQSRVVGETVIWKFPSFAVDENAADVIRVSMHNPVPGGMCIKECSPKAVGRGRPTLH